MKNYSISVYDDIGNAYPRKNTYLQELAQLQMQLKTSDGPEGERLKQAIATLKGSKKNHAYTGYLTAYKQAERGFLAELKPKAIDFFNTLPKGSPRRLNLLEKELFMAKASKGFYSEYAEANYDAQLAFMQSDIKTRQLPEIIENYKRELKALEEAKAQLAAVDPKVEAKAKAKLDAFKIEQQEAYVKGRSEVLAKRKSGLISVKALQNSMIELRRKRRESVHIASFESPSKNLKSVIANKRYLVTKGISRQLKVMRSNLSDVRRTTPVETEKTTALFAYITAPIPGLGQLLNKQYVKAALFFLGALFIYFIAIPYALGYGNYQGDGIGGLISLAEGGKKIHKSLIYMIEGIVAMFLMVFAFSIYWLNFTDVLHVERDMIKGIRPRTWFESGVKIEQEGFPYIVSVPALVVTVFVVLVPITTAILLSFTGMDPQHQSKFGWVGLENYKLIALGQGMAGAVFWKILGWTLIWTLVSSSLAILVGFMLAILANNERIIGKAVIRIVYLLPWAVPAFITIMFFSIMFSPNGALTQIINNTFGISLDIKNDTTMARTVLILLQTWLGSSYIFLLATGVLQAIPEDLYEAAQIDGATEWQKLRHITVPMVLFQTAPLLVGQYTFNFNNFSIIFLFNSGGPFNPTKYGNLAGSTDILISYVFKLTTENQYQAVGAAITIVISLGLMVFAFIGFKNSKAFKEERL